jgi:hypothetical protein
MSPKAVVRALGTLVVLLFLWGAFALFRGSLSDTTSTLSLPALTMADVDLIEFAQGADTVRFTKHDGNWEVNGYPADYAQVGQLFAWLTDEKITTEMIARNPASHTRLGVDSGGRRVTFRNGADTVLDLIVGSSGRGFQTAYARLVASEDVFLVRGSLGSLVRRDADSWRDRRIAAIDPEGVRRVDIWRGRDQTILTRDGNAWTLGGSPTDTATTGRLLRALSNIAAIGFATDAEADSLDFREADRRLTVLGSDADTLLDLLMDSTAAGYWVRRAARPEVFRLDFWRVDELTPAPGALRGAQR